MAILHQDRRLTAHYIVSEQDYLSRDVGIIVAGSGALKAGAVLGEITATPGSFAPVDPAANDGTQVARAILFEGCDATTEDVHRTLTRRLTEVQESALIWPVGMTDTQIKAALAELATHHIVAR